MKNLKPTIILFVFLLSNISYAQEFPFFAPEYDLIKVSISDTSSNFYYPLLLERFKENDTTLSLEDFRHLYYGYTFLPEYEPYWSSPYGEKLSKYYNSTEIKGSDYDKIIKLIKKSLEENPLDLRQLNFLSYIYHLKGDQVRAERTVRMFYGVIDAILSSGDGKTCKTGYHVISTSHEYTILSLFEFQFTSQSLTTDLCDYMEVKKDERDIEGLYFNISRLWNKNMEKYK